MSYLFCYGIFTVKFVLHATTVTLIFHIYMYKLILKVLLDDKPKMSVSQVPRTLFIILCMLVNDRVYIKL